MPKITKKSQKKEQPENDDGLPDESDMDSDNYSEDSE